MNSCSSTQSPAAILSKAQDLARSNLCEDAVALLTQEIDAHPGRPDLLAGLGAVLHRQGRIGDAIRVLKKAVALDPTLALARDNLGVVLRHAGRLREAIEQHEQAVRIRPDFARAHLNHGLALEYVHRPDAAMEAFRKALVLDSSLAGAHAGIGRLHLAERSLEDAETSFRAAIAIDKNRGTALAGLASVHAARHDYPAAVRIYRRLCRIQPNNTSTKLALAQCLGSMDRDHDALRIYRSLEKLGVAHPALWFGKAAALSNLGKFHAADRYYRKALAADPSSRMRSGYLFMLHAAALKPKSAMLRELRKWEETRQPANGPPRDPAPRDLASDRQLRVGYLSPDFRQHVVRQFFEPVMRAHDSDGFRFFCYAEVEHPDLATASLRALADGWRTTHGRTDAQVARQIEADGIDILVDLAGHTANNRLGVMLLKPAPVQATYLGYFGSTGLSTIDYWISDGVLLPRTTEEPSTEQIYRLPRTAFCYGIPAHARARTRHRTDPEKIALGCFNNVSKVGFTVIDAWAEILRRADNTRLILKDRRFRYGPMRHTWRKRFSRRGIDPDRIDLLPASPHDLYMESYNDIDISLDPFPRTGGTTTCDALWMGVPVVTLAGKRYVERLSATKLVSVGVEELITTSVDEYVAKVIQLTQNPAALDQYHETLRGRMMRSPLCDALSLAQALEAAYREMWIRYAHSRTADEE